MARGGFAHSARWVATGLLVLPGCGVLQPNECNNPGEAWCVGDEVHMCFDNSDSEVWGPDRSDVTMDWCGPGMCASWKNTDGKAGAGCMLTKDPCPAGVQWTCLGAYEMAWCSPDRQALYGFRGDGPYCMVSPVDGEAYLAYATSTCSPDGIRTDCQGSRCFAEPAATTCYEGHQLVCEKGLWLGWVDGCLASCLPDTKPAKAPYCVNAARLACPSNPAPFCVLGKVLSCVKTATDWAYDTVDCLASLVDYDFANYHSTCVELGAGKLPTCAFSTEACAPEGATRCAGSADGQRSGYVICRGQVWAEEVLCPNGCVEDASGARCL
jgi:hypothetical protein